MTEPDPYAEVPPPSPADGPQYPIDESELEEVGHAIQPEGVDDDEFDVLLPGIDLVEEAKQEAGEEAVERVRRLVGSEG